MEWDVVLDPRPRELVERGRLEHLQEGGLLVGIEDGRLTTEVHEDAPTCGECDRYINPRRKECVYCGAAIEYTRPPKTRKRQVRKVECERCAGVVPQRSTYYTTHGLLCERCFVEVGEG
jgi:formylmethanofuran dehydrogenase subunit E